MAVTKTNDATNVCYHRWRRSIALSVAMFNFALTSLYTGVSVAGVAPNGGSLSPETARAILMVGLERSKGGVPLLLKRIKPSLVIPGALVVGVLALSFFLPRTFNLPGASLTSYGYGYGAGGTCAPPPVQYHPLTPVRILDTRSGGTALGANATMDVPYNAFGNTDVVFDVNGYVSTDGTCATDGLYRAVVPARILDTRTTTQVAANSTIDVQVTGRGGVPATGVEAVTLNLTETNATAGSYITAYPTGTARPLASNVNFVAGQTVPNRVIVKLGTGGQITLYNAFGNVDLIADVNGWFTDNTGTTIADGSGDVFVGITPNRILDTRGGGAIPANASVTLTVTGVPAAAHAAVLNVTVTNPTSGSYLTVWPDGVSRPLASDLNFVSGLTVANLVIVQLGGGSKVDIYNAFGSTDVVVDVVGWYQ